MKEYKVRVLKYFRDKEEKKERFIGEEFECTKERCNYLLEHNAVEIINNVPEITEEQVQAVANAIVEEAMEQDKTIEEIVDEIVEEAVDEVVDEIITKKRRKTNKK